MPLFQVQQPPASGVLGTEVHLGVWAARCSDAVPHGAANPIGAAPSLGVEPLSDGSDAATPRTFETVRTHTVVSLGVGGTRESKAARGRVHTVSWPPSVAGRGPLS